MSLSPSLFNAFVRININVFEIRCECIERVVPLLVLVDFIHIVTSLYIIVVFKKRSKNIASTPLSHPLPLSLSNTDQTQNSDCYSSFLFVGEEGGVVFFPLGLVLVVVVVVAVVVGVVVVVVIVVVVVGGRLRLIDLLLLAPPPTPFGLLPLF